MIEIKDENQPTVSELNLLVSELNGELYEVKESEELCGIQVASNGDDISVMFYDLIIWTTADDDREFDYEKDIPAIGVEKYIRAKLNETFKALSNIKF